ncbi:MAG: GatB/YqeY domain-containing protein [Actinomycetota bacterium]
MGTLKSQMQADLNDAMRAGDDTVKSTLRMALAAVTNAEVAGDQAVELTDDQIVKVLQGEAKKRAEAAEIYENAGRAESAAKERAEAEVLARYLPAAVGADQLQSIVDEEVAAAASRGATGLNAMGQVVKAVRDRVGSGADGAVIADMVKAALA